MIDHTTRTLRTVSPSPLEDVLQHLPTAGGEILVQISGKLN